MNKIQNTLTNIVIQYVKETYPNDVTLKYLIDGIDNFSDSNIQTEVERPNMSGPIPKAILEEKDRIKEIMNKVLDVNFKPIGTFVKPNDIFVEEDKNIPTDEIRYNTNIGSTSGTSGFSGTGSTSGNRPEYNPNLIDETLKEINKIPTEDISKFINKNNPPWVNNPTSWNPPNQRWDDELPK